MPRRKTAPTVTERIDAGQLVAPASVPAADRERYWIELLPPPGTPEQDEAWQPFMQAMQTTEFFPLIEELPAALWDSRALIYVYRLRPEVKNAQGQKNYIGKYSTPIDEEFVRTNFGGGKFRLMLNIDRIKVKDFTFDVDMATAPPKFQPGQTLANGEAVPGTNAPPTEHQRSETAQVVTALTEANKTSSELLMQGAAAAIDLQGKIYEKAAGVNTPPVDSTKQAIELITALRTAFPPPPAPPTPPDPLETALRLMERLEKINERHNPPEPEHEEKPFITQLQEMTGIENVPDLMKRVAGVKPTGDEVPGWITMGLNVVSKLIDNLPSIVYQIGQNQERAMILRGITPVGTAAAPGAPAQPIARPAALPPPPPPLRSDGTPQVINMPPPPRPPAPAPLMNQPTAPPSPAVPAAPTPTPGAVVNPDDPAAAVPVIVQMLCNAFDRDPRSGYGCAAAIDHLFPAVIEQMEAVLLDIGQLHQFVANTPALAERSKHPRWKNFERGFLSYFGPEDEEDEDEPGALAMPPQPAAKPVAAATPAAAS